MKEHNPIKMKLGWSTIVKKMFISCIVIITLVITACLDNNPQNRVIGQLQPRSSNEIKQSVFSVGFETLDRELFDPQKCYDALGKLGVKWARCQTGWNRCEKVKGHYSFQWLDEVVDSLLAVGIQPWFNVGYGNKLYTQGAENNSAVGWVPTNSEEAMIGWENFVRELASHFQGRVNHYEIWNEPNVDPFWRPGKPTPQKYVEFIKRTEVVLHEVIPGAVIIGGGFGGFPTDFLTQCLDLGLANHIDKLSYHPYMLVPEGDSTQTPYVKSVSAWRKLIAKYNSNITLWQGECGSPSTNYSVGALNEFNWNEASQAHWLLRRLINDLRLGVELISWYHTCDQEGYGKAVYEPDTKVNAFFGLLRLNDYSPKPSYYAYQNICAIFDSHIQVNERIKMTFETSGSFDNDKIEQANFADLSVPLSAYWKPVDVTKNSKTHSTDITLELPSGMQLTNPVLIDPMTGSVIKLFGNRTVKGIGFRDLPLKNYPMLITDLNRIEISNIK